MPTDQSDLGESSINAFRTGGSRLCKLDEDNQDTYISSLQGRKLILTSKDAEKEFDKVQYYFVTRTI